MKVFHHSLNPLLLKTAVEGIFLASNSGYIPDFVLDEKKLESLTLRAISQKLVLLLGMVFLDKLIAASSHIFSDMD